MLVMCKSGKYHRLNLANNPYVNLKYLASGQIVTCVPKLEIMKLWRLHSEI